MPVDDDETPKLDLPSVYAHYVETCRRLNVEPVLRDRALGLMQEWSDTLASGGIHPTRH